MTVSSGIAAKAFPSFLRRTGKMMRWCTVTVTGQEGRRHSVNLQATSTFDAGHLYVVEAKKERAGPGL
jgi:hypothetical protein